jgi:hypothetical protein
MAPLQDLMELQEDVSAEEFWWAVETGLVTVSREKPPRHLFSAWEFGLAKFWPGACYCLSSAPSAAGRISSPVLRIASDNL